MNILGLKLKKNHFYLVKTRKLDLDKQKIILNRQ